MQASLDRREAHPYAESEIFPGSIGPLIWVKRVRMGNARNGVIARPEERRGNLAEHRHDSTNLETRKTSRARLAHD